jgi:TRAP-type C4-dicarboxylate transport system permease small subunit
MRRYVELTLAALLFLMFVVTFFQVLARSVFHVSAVWSEELARLTYVWMVFFGVGILIQEEGLIRVTALLDRVDRRVARVLRVLGDLAVIPFLAVLTWGAWTNTVLNWTTVTPTIDWLTMGYIYLGICISGVMMLWYQVAKLIEEMRASSRRAAHGPEGWQ